MATTHRRGCRMRAHIDDGVGRDNEEQPTPVLVCSGGAGSVVSDVGVDAALRLTSARLSDLPNSLYHRCDEAPADDQWGVTITMLRNSLRKMLAPAALAAMLVAGSGGTAGAAPAAASPVPAHAYTPYFETWTSDGLAATARASGARYLTLAFVETPGKHSCVPAWDGDPSMTVAGGHYVHQIANLRRLGGDVVPSFGGYSADHALTEIADSCRNMTKLVAAYKSVITTLGVTRLDMDVEDRSLEHTSGIDRRNEALARVERWAARHERPLQLEYTLPTSTTGLESDGMAVLRSAIAHHTRVDFVNIMTFDYYDGVTHDMGAAAIGAAHHLFHQLHSLYPGKTAHQLWGMQGNTLMAGIDDYGPPEVTTLRDARRLHRFAARVGLGLVSIWAIQRDNGGCPGEAGANECSGIPQPRWGFGHILG